MPWITSALIFISVIILSYLLYIHLVDNGTIPISNLETDSNYILKKESTSNGNEIVDLQNIQTLIGNSSQNTTQTLFGYENLIKANTDKIPTLNTTINTILTNLNTLNGSSLSQSQVQTIINTMITNLNLTNKTMNALISYALTSNNITTRADLLTLDQITGGMDTELASYGAAKTTDIPTNTNIQTDVNNQLVSYGAAKTTDITSLNSNVSNGLSNLVQQLPSDGSVQTDVNLKLTSYGVAKTSDLSTLATSTDISDASDSIKQYVSVQVVLLPTDASIQNDVGSKLNSYGVAKTSDIPTDSSIQSDVNSKLISYGVAKTSDIPTDSDIQTDIVAGLESYQAATTSDVQGVSSWMSNNLPTDTSIQSDVGSALSTAQITVKNDISSLKTDLESYMAANLPTDSSIAGDVSSQITAFNLASQDDVSTASTNIISEIDNQISTLSSTLSSDITTINSNTNTKTGNIDTGLNGNFTNLNKTINPLAKNLFNCDGLSLDFISPDSPIIDYATNLQYTPCNFLINGSVCNRLRCAYVASSMTNPMFMFDGYNLEYLNMNAVLPDKSFYLTDTKITYLKSQGIGSHCFNGDEINQPMSSLTTLIIAGPLGDTACNYGCNALSFLDLSQITGTIGTHTCQNGCGLLETLNLGQVQINSTQNFENVKYVHAHQAQQDALSCNGYINSVEMETFYTNLGSLETVMIMDSNNNFVIQCQQALFTAGHHCQVQSSSIQLNCDAYGVDNGP